MKTKGKGVSLSQLWKRNAVVAAIALFVCAAVYLNWNYEQETAAGKTLGSPPWWTDRRRTRWWGLRHCRTGGPDSGHG